MSRLAIELTTEQHQQIKTLASMRGKSIKEFVLEQIFPIQISEEEQAAWEKLQSMLSSRIAKAGDGTVSQRTFAQITDAVIQERN